MADMVMAAGIDAAGDVDVQPADHFGGVVVGKARVNSCAIGIERALASEQ